MAGRNWTWNYNDALSYLTDMGTEFVGNPPGSAKGWFYPFIVPGSARYQDAMDLAVNQALSGTTSAQAALDACAKAWDGITSDYGKDAQMKAYQVSIGYGKPINAGL
jgi:hypothetical protein